MNCPICLANIPAMGFRFDPPMEYFEKIFKKLATMNPIPKIQIFGGEPTVREDLIEFITLAKSYGISARVVTNGIRLADEEYCKSLLKTGCQLMFGFDGRSPDIYRKIRKNPTALDKKMAAFQNIRKHRKSKVTIMCAVGYGINDNYMADLIDFCFESRDFVAALDLIPLAANWGPETVDAESSTPEDVEKIMADAIPGVEFFPAGILYRFNTLKETFNLRLTFGGAHPNCESVSLMISDGTKYQPLSKYLKHSQSEAIKEAVALDAAMGRKVETSLFAKIFGKTGRKILVGLAFLKLLRKHGDFDQVFNGGKFTKTFKILMGVLFGQKLKTMLRKHTRCQNILRLMVLPFEEKECVESARLVDCAQLVAHRPLNMGAADDPEHLDFAAFSAHKMYAPFGSGALIGPKSFFEDGPPGVWGGGAVDLVSLNEIAWSQAPEKEEAGTPNLIGILAMAKAAEILMELGMDNVEQHEKQLTAAAMNKLKKIEGIILYGKPESSPGCDRVSVIPILPEKMNHALLAAALGYEWGIGVRNGCFCAHPYIEHLFQLTDQEIGLYMKQIRAGDHSELPGFVRISLGLYNTEQDLDYLSRALGEIMTNGPRYQYRQKKETGEYLPENTPDSFDLDLTF